MLTLVGLVRVLLILVLALFTISLVIGIGSPGTGAVEKVALLALIVGCIVVAAQVSKWATKARERSSRH